MNEASVYFPPAVWFMYTWFMSSSGFCDAGVVNISPRFFTVVHFITNSD